VRLYILQYSVNRETGSPVPGYLIQTDDGTNVLVDTGYPRSMIGTRMNEEDYVVNRLAELGVTPADIRYLVCTHFDGDHAGGHDEFRDAELVVQRTHYEVARQHSRFDGVREHWDRPELRYRQVDGDTELLPGIELIESGGHVPGHQSVLVRLPNTGPVLLAIDAISRASHLDPDTRPIGPYDADEAATRASTRKLVELARREGVALIVHGHDAEQWKTLRKAPEYYD
jgi:N-acyl homoserine lactone hydrolase